jgi:hypothetical protein
VLELIVCTEKIKAFNHHTSPSLDPVGFTNKNKKCIRAAERTRDLLISRLVPYHFSTEPHHCSTLWSQQLDHCFYLEPILCLLNLQLHTTPALEGARAFLQGRRKYCYFQNALGYSWRCALTSLLTIVGLAPTLLLTLFNDHSPFCFHFLTLPFTSSCNQSSLPSWRSYFILA